ncbi:hypothetical protein FFLO_03620 [Filobasidium floriforme]|uniref:ABM domain-containing protein n=1 Tax=Filobasidium floriforme TaxID=5210 RepID=A0A8K0JKB9_9TREE|nr:uncharacterized protein HD553DRAFT_21163 [Filobasidium floriforme]KAG7535874.1 hypothetical protein FFLO_03620 [Filobasidium floriforme]KAH8090942.1 hypothetical protein HD553DRAFT_21163 [Filobasidium floriforme]
MTTIVQTQPKPHNPLPQGQLPYSSQFEPQNQQSRHQRNRSHGSVNAFDGYTARTSGNTQSSRGVRQQSPEEQEYTHAMQLQVQKQMQLQMQMQMQSKQQAAMMDEKHYPSSSQHEHQYSNDGMEETNAELEMEQDSLVGPSVCVHIVMTVKSEWIHEVKFLIQRIKKWAEAHEPGLLTFRATVAVDNPCEIRLFQEYSNLDAYRVHETNPFMQEMVNGLADYLEEDMEFFESQEFAL